MKKQECPSSYFWIRYEAKGLKRTEEKFFAMHLQKCETCQEKRLENQVLRYEIRQDPIYQTLLREGSSQPPQKKTATSFFELWYWFAGGLSVAFVLLLSLTSFPQLEHHREQIQNVPKGKWHPEIRMLHYSKGNQHSRWTEKAEVLHPGDLIQFDYHFKKPVYLMILSMNQKGMINQIVPFGKIKSALFQAGQRTIPKDGSLELDNYLGEERIFVIYNKKPFQLEKVRKDLQKAYKLSQKRLAKMNNLPMPWDGSSFYIIKKP